MIIIQILCSFPLFSLLWLMLTLPSAMTVVDSPAARDRMEKAYAILEIQEQQPVVLNALFLRAAAEFVLLCIASVALVFRYRSDSDLPALFIHGFWILTYFLIGMYCFLSLRKQTAPTFLGYGTDEFYIFRPITLNSVLSLSWSYSVSTASMCEGTTVFLLPGKGAVMLDADCKTSFIKERLGGKQSESSRDTQAAVFPGSAEKARTVLSAIVEKYNHVHSEILFE